MEFFGYERANGSAGVRNVLAILSSDISANNLATILANNVIGMIPILLDDVTLRLREDKERTLKTVIGLGKNPNVAAVVIVGSGEESIDVISQEIVKSKKPVEVVTILGDNGFQKALDKGEEVAKRFLAEISQQQRRPLPISHLTIGLKCGGSNTTSGIIGNPVTGQVIDRLIAFGGSAVFSETTELIGATHLLEKRAANKDIALRLRHVVERMEVRIGLSGEDIRGTQPTSGNIKGGLTTIEEKSLGALSKTGTSLLRGVLENAESPQEKGLFFMDGTASTIPLIVAEAAAGVQILIYSFGGGISVINRSLPGVGTTRLPILPIISVLSNAGKVTDKKLTEFYDVFANKILDGTETIQQVADRLFHEVISVASGKLTKLEMCPYIFGVPLEIYHTGPIL
jgi:altronate dehydratase large subunit